MKLAILLVWLQMMFVRYASEQISQHFYKGLFVTALVWVLILLKDVRKPAEELQVVISKRTSFWRAGLYALVCGELGSLISPVTNLVMNFQFDLRFLSDPAWLSSTGNFLVIWWAWKSSLVVIHPALGKGGSHA